MDVSGDFADRLEVAWRGDGKARLNDVDAQEAEKVVAEIKEAGGKAVASAANAGSREGAESLAVTRTALVP